jgi:hypothetical protein
MCRLADLCPGTGKTDARDAYVIADAVRTLTHLLHSIDPDESVRAELNMVLGHDDDLAQGAETATAHQTVSASVCSSAHSGRSHGFSSASATGARGGRHGRYLATCIANRSLANGL